MDYGAPVGYRLALKHPERVTALIVQNGNAYEEGLKAFWDPIKAYWADRSQEHRERDRRAGRAGDHQIPVHRRHHGRLADRSRQLAGTTGAAGPDRATRTSSSIFSSTTEPTSRSIRNSRRSSASESRRR